MLKAPTFMRPDTPDFGQGFEERRLVLFFAEVQKRFAHHQLRPPSALPLTGPPCSFLSLSRSAHILSMLASIRANRASAGSEFIPAL
jgi:hypothetical protein